MSKTPRQQPARPPLGGQRRAELLQHLQSATITDIELIAALSLGCSRDDHEVLAAVRPGILSRPELLAAVRVFLQSINRSDVL